MVFMCLLSDDLSEKTLLHKLQCIVLGLLLCFFTEPFGRPRFRLLGTISPLVFSSTTSETDSIVFACLGDQSGSLPLSPSPTLMSEMSSCLSKCISSLLPTSLS